MPDLTDKFRRAFRGYPAGVSIVTATVDGQPVGMTMSSLSSLAIDPLSVAFSISQPGGAGSAMLRASSFLIHLLGAEHAGLAALFAQKGSERFTEEQGWQYLDTGEPWLPTVPAAIRTRPLSMLKVGTAHLVVAEVLSIHEGPAADPLVYHDRTFLSVDELRTALTFTGD